MKNLKNYYILALSLLVTPQLTLAQENNRILNSITTIGHRVYGGDPADLKTVIANLIAVALGFVGIIFLLLIIWSGFRWMTSGGNEKTIEAAKATLRSSTIGLVIVMAGYSIAVFIANSLSKAVGSN